MTFLSSARRACPAAVLFLCLLTGEENARAATSLATDNGGGIDTRLFRSAVDSKGFFTVDGSEVLGKNDLAFGLILDAGFSLLRLREDPGRSEDKVIGTQLHGVLFIGWSPLRNLAVGVGIPTDLVSGDPIAGRAPFGIAPDRKTDVNAFFTGTWMVHAKYRLLRVDEAPIGLAIVLQAETALSDDARRGYAASPGVTLTPKLALEKRFGRLRVGANVGASALTAEGSRIGELAASRADVPLQHGHLARAGVAVGYRLTDDLDLVAESYGSRLLSNDAGGLAGTSVEAVSGVRVFVEKNSYLFLGGGVGLTKGYQAAAQRGFLGFVFEPSIGDRDGDGVPDDVDKCPDTPEDRDGFHDEDGCPDPDNDEDGFLDVNDACPNEAETWNSYMDHDGCPDQVPGETDHGQMVDEPQKPVLEITDNIGVLLNPIQFEFDSPKIKAESLPVVDQVAKLLLEHPEYTLVEVSGHADERGNDLYNLQLTQKRVDEVVRALVKRGVPANRLHARGYGEYCPLDESHDEAAWTKNRRVEFRVVMTNGIATGVALGCKNATAHGVTP